MFGGNMSFARLNPIRYGQKREPELPPLIKHEIIYIQSSSNEIDKLCKETSDYITSLKKHNSRGRIKKLRQELKLIGVNRSLVTLPRKKNHRRKKTYTFITPRKSSQDLTLLAYKRYSKKQLVSEYGSKIKIPSCHSMSNLDVSVPKSHREVPLRIKIETRKINGRRIRIPLQQD
ncbi:unnamed protein product [Moneuplotes crassus]|uniref:Uncharacterized protein n=1 Tax=Euplotes crassus TaxID=5936 RepID=A0AAD1XYQ8_EUPCR|nr:unnamed protein product [Moneuplotes crassus]